MDHKVLLDSKEISEKLRVVSENIYKDIKNIDDFSIVGIQTRGVELAGRIKSYIEEFSGKTIKYGTIDSTFYRDDLATRGVLPVIKETNIDFNISNKVILLVDDVIFTGRTTKAALETIMAFGRPSSIKLFVLVDRGNRELPIQPDYLAYSVETDIKNDVKVILENTDEEEDKVILISTKI